MEQLYTTAVRNMTISAKGYSEQSNVIEMIDNEKKGDSRDVCKERLNLAVCHGQRAPCISGTFILQS